MPTKPAKTNPNYALKGLITDLKGKPLVGLTIRAYDQDPKTPDNPLGKEAITDANGNYTINFTEVDFKIGGVESGGPDVYICIYGEGDKLAQSDVHRNATNQITINQQVDFAASPEKTLTGNIILEHGLPSNNLKLRLYSFAFGGTAIRIGETITDEKGHYTLPYHLRNSANRLEVRAVDVTDEETALSKPFNERNESLPKDLNLIAPGELQPLEAEYKRLTSDLIPRVGEMKNLVNVKEDDKTQDITVLNRATGWDARLIALAATTERLSAGADVKLSQESVYGLLRAGLPSDKLMLAQVEPDVAEQALKTVRNAGIVELNDQQIGDFKKQFATFATKVRLNVPVPGSRSTYGALLNASGLHQDAQDKFAPVYLSHRGDPAQLWDEARKVGLDDAQVGKLQLQGKLAFLAGNSEAMTTRLMQKKITDPVQLVEQNFHSAEAWSTEIFEQAGIPANRRDNLTDADKKKLDELIPPAYTADKVEDRLHAYTDDMARKVRLSYPTQVVGRLIEQDEIKLPAARDATVTLMKSAAGQGFRLGQTPVSTFLKTHVGVTAGMTASDVNVAQEQMMTLQRVYQITPSNEAMPVLISLGMTSAYDVMAYSEVEFVDLYARGYFEIYHRPPTQSESHLVYRKAKQVSSVTYNLFTIAKKLDSEPPVAGMSAPVEVRESVRNELIKQFPTMESLFGSMDFCECEHCHSVLSPAAYLVDLLQFVDAEPGVWGNFLAQWKATHDNQDYPHKDKNGTPMKPYDALKERRPDLPHIALTCENTHTALPYIDIVNEILEYYVANGKLEEEAAHDTGEATTAELLAEPQNVIRGAYDKLREARYPLTLPFDLWIETARQFCNYFETPLERVLEVFRKSDDLFAPNQPFDRAAIFMESLGLSPAEEAIFTDQNPLAGNMWHELYGFPPDISFQSPTNAGNATVTVTNSGASKLREAFSYSYFDVSAGAMSTDSLHIQTIGAPDSDGNGQALITLDDVWSSLPQAGDLLVCIEPEALRSAKALSRQLGVTYKEIAEIIQAGFVNPNLIELTLLYKLGVTIQDARLYKVHKVFFEQNKDLIGADRGALSPADQVRFDSLSNTVPNTQMTGWEIVNEVAAFELRLNELATTFNKPLNEFQTYVADIPFDKILVLADPDAGCDFDLTTLQYADGKKAEPIDFLRLNLFVRLWRKLGWSIEETDRALTTFIPQSAPYNETTANLAEQPFKTALIYFAHLKALDEKIKVGKQSRFKLLALWSNIATTGKKSLYAQLFLTRSMLKSDDVFDHPLRRYLLVTEIATMAQSRWHKVQEPNVAPANQIDPAAFAGEPKVKLSYDPLQEVQRLEFKGELSDPEKAALNALSPSPALPKLLDAVQVKAREFKLIKGHLLALQGALGLTADEIGRILEDNSKSLDSAELSLTNVSLIYRYRLLAKALKLSVRELIALKQLSGLDPFKSLHPNPLMTIDDDHPFSQTLRFIDVAEEVKDNGLKIEDLEYLLRHRFDETGKYRPNREGTLTLLKTLSEGIRAIRTEHAVPNDRGALSEEVLRQKLGLALPTDVVERFLAMVNGTIEFTATNDRGVALTDKLKPEDFAGEPAIRELRYNETRQEQKLTYRGVLFDAPKTELETRFNGVLAAQQKLDFAELLGGVQSKAREFFDNQLKKQKLRLEGEAGFLEDADFTSLFSQLEPLKKISPNDTQSEIDGKLKDNEEIENKNQEQLRNRRYRIAQAFFPFLQQRLIRQFIVQTMTAQAGAEPVLVESLLTDERLLGGLKPLLDVFAATGERGVSAAFFNSDDGSGAPQATPSIVTSVDTALKDKKDTNGNPLNPANSARFEGYLEVPAPGAYRFYIMLDKQNAEAELQFPHRTEAVFLSGVAATNNAVLGDQPSEFLELKPGISYRFRLALKKLNGGEARLLVQGESIPKESVSQLTLYPLTSIQGAERAVLLLTKALQLVTNLGLSEREIRYLLTHPDKFDNLNLKTLPVQDAQHALDTIAAGKMEADNTLSKEQALLQTRNENPELASEADQVTPQFKQFLRLAAYARLKRDLAGGTDDLINIFEANGTGDLDKVYPLIAKLTRRDEATIKATTNALFAMPAFESEKPLQRLWEALQAIERFGVPVVSLVGWTRIVSPAVTPDQRFEIARDLKEAIKARFEPETWQNVAQPIFDKLRQCQRDALVAHVMHQHDFARMEQLYEYFLIDPGMEPVVQTSRIRLAIASLQLFIQRCLLNMELQVHPSVINSKQWEWMKRYRVWEANRKIFLFPENWLEPEFRDDKTHLFSELEGALLQGDVSSDLVEDAFLNYLKKLDELARLDIVAMHLEDDPDPARRTLHVIGRTYSQPHKYFYRRYDHQMWTSWEPVSAEIEGDHLVPVIWRDRLYLFWVTFIERAEQDINSQNTFREMVELNISDSVQKKIEIQLHWSEYLQGEWTTRESGGFATISKTIKNPFNPKSVFVHVSKEPYEASEERGVYIHLGGAINQAFYLAGRNSAPEQANYAAKPNNPYNSANTELANRYSGSGELKVSFQERITTEPGKTPPKANPSILQQGSGYTLLPCDNNLIALGVSEDAYLTAANQTEVRAAIERGVGEIASLMKPVFYQDNAHTLFVEPSVTERTIEEWQDWVTRTPQPEPGWRDPNWWTEIVVIPEIPKKWPIPDPRDPRGGLPIDLESLINPIPIFDWLVNPGTGLMFDDVLLGPAGQPGLEILTTGVVAEGGIPINVNPGSGLASGNTVILTGTGTLEKAGLTQVIGGMNLIGRAGFNSALANNFNELNRPGMPAAGGFER